MIETLISKLSWKLRRYWFEDAIFKHRVEFKKRKRVCAIA